MPEDLKKKSSDIFKATYNVMIEGEFAGGVTLYYSYKIDGGKICALCNEESVTFVPVITGIRYVTDKLGEEVSANSSLWLALLRGAFIKFKGDARMVPFAVCACDEILLPEASKTGSVS